MLGAVGSDATDFLKTGLQAGGAYGKQALDERDAKKLAVLTAADDDKKAQATIAADQAAVTANAEALYAESIAAKNPNSAAYKVAADAARAEANAAGSVQASTSSGLSDAARKKRSDYADANAVRYANEAMVAARASLASPKDVALLDKAQHANFYTLAAQAVAMASKGQTPPSNAEMIKLAEKLGASLDSGIGAFFMRKYGFLPVYVWGGLGVGILYAVKKGLIKRLIG